MYQDVTFLQVLVFTIIQKTLIFAQAFINLTVIAQKLEIAGSTSSPTALKLEAVTGTYKTVCLFGVAGLPYVGNFWFRIQTFKGFLPNTVKWLHIRNIPTILPVHNISVTDFR